MKERNLTFYLLLSLLTSSSIYCCSIHAQILEPVISGFQHIVKNSSSSGILQDFVVRLELLWYLNYSLNNHQISIFFMYDTIVALHRPYSVMQFNNSFFYAHSSTLEKPDYIRKSFDQHLLFCLLIRQMTVILLFSSFYVFMLVYCTYR